VPVLKEIEKGISKEGRLCSVNNEVEGRMYPYTELKFKPEEGFGRNSSIRFEHSKPCKILMREKIKTDDFNGREASIEVDNLKAEWVKKKTNEFIKNALKQY
jgi:hypothetical protein